MSWRAADTTPNMKESGRTHCVMVSPSNHPEQRTDVRQSRGASATQY
jgi:hypothetical protein